MSSLDASVFQWVLSHRFPFLNQAMVFLSHGGGFAWVCSTVVLGFLFPRRWSGIYQVALAIGLAALLADFAAKPLVGRQRPSASFSGIEVMAARQRSASLPSTHAASSFAAASAMSHVFPELRVPLWIAAALVAFSRVYVGVHYPLDVVAGALLGIAVSVFVVGGTRWYDDQLAARR